PVHEDWHDTKTCSLIFFDGPRLAPIATPHVALPVSRLGRKSPSPGWACASFPSFGPSEAKAAIAKAAIAKAAIVQHEIHRETHTERRFSWKTRQTRQCEQSRLTN